ncbi:hypothetical protein RI129_012694 [Pyrocoelia pectoralis]|uniref:Glutamate-gated chloride channel n=1 Tax=Pyrocoelia pectoralis TaxID=417401 RepID=A0AAN7V6U5_9COLE
MTLFSTLIFFSALLAIRCESRREKEKEILDQILSPERYDARLRPPGLNNSGKLLVLINKVINVSFVDGATVVQVNAFIRTISSIDDLRMQYSVQLTFRQQWQDARLKYETQDARLRFLTLTEPRHIWEPDLFFSNENEGHFHVMMKPNLYYRIFPDGHVLYSRRLSLTLGCPMNFKLFPFDQPICTIRMASYGYTTEDIDFRWKDGDPVQVVRNLQLPKLSLRGIWTDYCTSTTSTGNYSCLKVDLAFKREFFFYLVQTYLPSTMMVILSWASFWFNPSEVQARMLLGLSTLLVLTIQTSMVNASMLQISYVKSIDIWTGGCLTFVFASFLEFVLVNHIRKRKNVKKCEDEIVPNNDDGQNEFSMKPLIDRCDKSLNGKSLMKKHLKNVGCCQSWLWKYSEKSESIDILSRILFPAVFVLFSLIYWISYAVLGNQN